MTYNIYQPAPFLRSLIDVYWHVSGRLIEPEVIKLLPDGGINLFVNLAEDIISTGFDTKIKHGEIYLVGPMMKTDLQILRNEVLLFGVRFRPGAFSYFYRHDSLDQLANQFHEWSRTGFSDLKKTMLHFVSYLDQFYLDRLLTPKHSVLNFVSDISQHVGSQSIEALARRHFMSERQLERIFKQQVGLPPKKLVELDRFRKAFAMLQSRSDQRIEEIAWDCGYYDHAHLTNDFKRFTGQPPSTFILSDFSKEIAGESM
ncbi:MAG: AraC family transcriptional regulator [Saprospiraceae bacterium]|nr:AraC family transcriptional regulator [Saprospiraceae bacterium]